VILHPSVVALLLGSLLNALLLVSAGIFAGQLLQHWDIASGSEEQLVLERRTYLVSTLVAVSFALQLGSLFFFISVVDSLSPLLVGAMCSAGVLNANPYGYPAILLKLVNFMLAGGWLVINYLDNKGFDYPLIRLKYLLLLVITPSFLVETTLVWLFFINLKVNVITSCCGSLFSEHGSRLAAGMVGLPPLPSLIALFAVLAATVASGFLFLKAGRGAWLCAGLAVLSVPVGMTAIISCISPYIYELPTHHCPFCILKREYGYVGYLLTGTLLAGGLAGVGVGVTAACQRVPSLRRFLPLVQRRLTITIIICSAVFALVVGWRMLATDFTLLGG
jgi:hypothetical protein